jgi:hypothetical protein
LLVDYPKGVDNDHNAHDQMGEPCSQRRQRGARAKYAEHHASDSADAPPLKQKDSGAPGSSRCQTASTPGAHDSESVRTLSWSQRKLRCRPGLSVVHGTFGLLICAGRRRVDAQGGGCGFRGSYRSSIRPASLSSLEALAAPSPGASPDTTMSLFGGSKTAARSCWQRSSSSAR